MAEHSTIEWTDATWNPITGCTIVSPGCTNCYAMKLAGTRLKNHPTRVGLTRESKSGPVWTGQVRFNEKVWREPLKWKRPRMIFVCAHGDLFHESVPDDWIHNVFAVMALCPQHTFQVLTKRSARMLAYVSAARGPNALPTPNWPLPNVWLGVSAERQQEADARIPDLLAAPAAVRFVSLEPLLGPVDLENVRQYNPHGKPWIDSLRGLVTRGDCLPRSPDEGGLNVSTRVTPPELPHLDWVIVGGESQAGARPMHPEWARALRDQCAAAGVPFFFKQWGEWRPATADGIGDPEYSTGKGRAQKTPAFFVAKDGTVHCFTTTEEERSQGRTVMLRIGKKAAGRLLDGVEHNGMPPRSLPAAEHREVA